jgi:protein TonB
MDLRCLVFTADSGTAEPICQVLAELGAEAEHCSQALAAVERIGREPFQIVIVDWDEQREAELVLKAARGRKASERPLTLAVVSDDAGLPKALQAGANSILRKPILVNQVKDTLQTARSLLKARHESSMAMAASASAAPGPAIAAAPGSDAHLRAREFLQTSRPASARQFDTESAIQRSIDRSAAAEIDPLEDLEPMAAAVTQQPSPPPRSSPEPRGLQWYLNQRAVPSPYILSHAEAPAPAPAPATPELIGFDQSPSHSETVAPASPRAAPAPVPNPQEREAGEQKAEAELFAYIDGEGGEPEQESGARFRLGKGAISFAVGLALFAIAAAPQAPWHPQARALWGRGRQSLHAWLNPQPVAPLQAPTAHEDFGRPGDEYKLPVAETIPDATTDPSQIRVVPVVDPTAKKPNNGGNADPNLAPGGTEASSTDPAVNPGDPNSAGQPQGNQGQGTAAPADSLPPAPPLAPPATGPGAITVTPLGSTTVAPLTTAGSAHPDPLVRSGSAASAPPVARNPQPRPVPPSSNPAIPSSLKSQMASMSPEASGNKAPESALPSIEPVNIPEATERTMILDQPAIAYPANTKAQPGSVVLQVLIGRDGTVEDAKFLQGSLAFARIAIDGVKRWKFNPYLMNGRPVSVQTSMTLIFKPGQ